MPESLFVQTEVLSLSASIANRTRIVNAGPDDLYLKATKDVSTTNYDSLLTANSSVEVSHKTWLVSSATGARVFAIEQVDYTTDMATQAELAAATFDGGQVTPSGPAGGVLSGTYPDPGFAQNMATQAELDAVAAAGSSPTGAAGGVLAGTYPNPTFQQDMATQTELNTAIAGVVSSTGGPAGGVLSGTYPNPAFAVDMATQAELNAAIAGVSGGEIVVSADTTGVVDATSALNAAYAAVVALGGGTMRIPPGTYKVSGSGLNMNQNSRVRVIGYGATLVGSGTTPTCLTIDPGGSIGGVVEGIRITNGTAGIGIKFRSALFYYLVNIGITGGAGVDTGILFSNEAAGYCESNTLINVYVASADIGIKWQVSGGTDSMEKQTFINVGVGGFTTGYSINSGVSMESVEMTNCMIQAAGINGATCLYLNGNLKGWKASLTVERLTGTNVLISNTDAACTNNNLADLRIHTLGTFAAAPNIKDAGISQPTIYKDGPDYKMAAALGGYVDRVFRDTDTQPRFRRSYSTFEWGPGGASGIDSNFGRLGSASVGSTTSKVTGYGLDASDQPITNVAPGVNADDAATVSQLGSGGGGTSGSVGVALHGSNASFTRPTGYGSIEWIGTVEPANAEDGDTFVDTNATGLFNVNNYGADPTGVADSTSAISDAIDALAASDSTTGVLYFPAGTYLLTPASPALELAAGTTVLGDGRSNTFLKVKNSPTSVSRIFDIAGGRVEFRNICFSGSTTPGAVTRNVIGIRHNNVAGIYTYMQNVGSLRMNNLLTSYDGVSQTVEAVDCYFDGGGIGSISGEAQENSTGLNCPHVGGGVIARNTTFTGWGSDTAAGSNFDHAIYLREETPLSIDGCQFLAQYDGRYIQVNGTAAAPGAGVAPAFWGVRNSYFGTPTTGNDMLHTSPLRRGIISDCEFAASTNYGNHVPAAIVPKGDVLISNCLFRGGASTHYTINALTASVKLSIKDCVFAGTSAIDILLNANSISLNVANCEFFSSATTSHVFQNTAKTFGYVIASDNNFQMASGCAAISSSTSGSFFAILAANNQFTTGAYGVRVQSGASCLVLQLRGNFFSGQTTTAVSKAGTVTTELSSNNFGYGVDGSYSVLNYGADPTGVADAQTQIQATLDACDTAGGGEVFIPKGTYILASGIKIGSNTTVRGQGNQSILKLKGGLSGGFPTSYVVTHKAYANATGTNSNIILRDFMIDGNKANCSADPLVGGAGNYPNAVLIFGVTGAGTRPSDIRVQNLCIKEAPLFSMALYRIDRLVCSNNVIYNGNRDGINADYSIDVTITGNVVDRVGDDHIVVGGTSKNVTISGNSVSEDSTTLARGKGIVVRGGTDVAITGNTVDSTCDAGIVVRDDFGDASRISIVGNKISDTGTGGGVTTYDGILLNATAGNTVKDISIVGNQINDALHNGIYVLNGGALGDLERIDIRSNQINNPATAGIKVDDNARNVTIDSNKIFSAGTVGILSTATNNEDLTVIDNHVNTSASHGIQLASFTDGYIANNYSHDNVGTGLILTPDTSVGVAWKDNFCQGNGTEYNIVGVTVASTAALAAPTQEVVTVSGTAAITSITGGFAGQRLFLVFSGTAAAAGLTDGSNLKLAGDFAYTPNDGISLVCDGTNWYETGRSVN